MRGTIGSSGVSWAARAPAAFTTTSARIVSPACVRTNPESSAVTRTPSRRTAPRDFARSKQLERRARGIDDGIRRNAKRSGEPATESWLGDLEAARVEDLGCDADSRVRLALCFERRELGRILGDPERAASLDFRSPIGVEAELPPKAVGVGASARAARANRP